MTRKILSEAFPEKVQQLLQHIHSAQKIALLGHKRPDEDAIGSQLAMREFIVTQLGKNADVISDPEHRNRPEILPGTEYIKEKNSLSGYDLVITHDSGEITHIFPSDIMTTKTKIIQIDNHAGSGNEPFGAMQILEPGTSATCHLMYYIFQEAGANITQSMATNLMTGIVYDTGKFQHSNTTPEVLRVAGDLLAKGAPLPKIQSTLYNKRSVSALKLWGKALQRVRVNKNTGMAVSIITKKDLDETGGDVEELSGLITMINSVKGSRFSLLLTEEAKDVIKGSLRSEEYKGVDVSKIARLLGGGGHKLASGFKITGKLAENERKQWMVE
jgi:phosphoesterase RecJ-like protein